MSDAPHPLSSIAPPAAPAPPRSPLETEKARGAYLAKVRHDLRTPINHIIGYCEMLQDEADDPGWTNFLADLGRVLDGGKQLLGLVNYHFDGAKVGPQKLDVHQLQHELRTPLNHIIGYSELLQEQAGEFGKK